MAPPSALTIATSSLERLIKEEASYHRELQEQEQRLQRLRTETNPDENQNWNIKQESKAIEETRAVFPALRNRITDALKKLENQLEADDLCGSENEEVEKAKITIQNARRSLEIKE